MNTIDEQKCCFNKSCFLLRSPQMSHHNKYYCSNEFKRNLHKIKKHRQRDLILRKSQHVLKMYI